jgi:hypothetical protein
MPAHPAEVIEGLLTESSHITKALCWSTMTDSAILRERIVDHGKRTPVGGLRIFAMKCSSDIVL